MSIFPSLPVSLPKSPLPQDLDPSTVPHALSHLFETLSPSSFVHDAVWRDCYALTGTFRTFYTNTGVFKAWSQTSAIVKPHSFRFDDAPGTVRAVKLPNGAQWVDLKFRFEAKGNEGVLGLNCIGGLNVVWDQEEGRWKVWSMRTLVEGIKGLPSVDCYEPPGDLGANGEAKTNGADPSAETGNVYVDCLIVGGGQAGLNMAGRCQALGIGYIVVDKNKEIGDSWKLRYKSARLHTIREYTNLAFDRTFTEEYEEYLGKDDIGNGYRRWAEKFGIARRFWKETTFEGGRWDSDRKRWTVRMTREGKPVEVNCAYVVMAVGAGGQMAMMPELPGREQFKGTILHSEQYHYPEGFADKHGIVIGTANTAHDIAEDMLEAGLASTTMVQRSTTYVLPVEYNSRVAAQAYNAKTTTAVADNTGFSAPLAVGRLIAMAGLHHAAAQEPERFGGLRKAGFKVEQFGDIHHHLYERLGGHYIDVGASAKIAKGLIKIKSDATPVRYTETGLLFSDGQELPVDLIVFATGFDRDVKGRARKLFGEEVAEHLTAGGVNEEGDVTMGRFEHPGLAYVGGTLGNCRWYPRFVALHMKAALMGRPFPAYLDTPEPVPRRPLAAFAAANNGVNGS
ncbi:dimethylaniline monooxygenase (N-oxide forming) [Xylogone sp. PMI_703]|nr:dimethylaniline monooxygenase (N-oxide forming) [Xylogone sp. PMI_703]